MKQTHMKAIIALLLSILILPAVAIAGGSSTACKTRYPVVLAHGMGFSAEVLGIVDYWWGIDNALQDEGCKVYKTSVNGMDSTAAKAAAFKQQYLQILAVSGAAKANIIAHSHGTLYTRYAITNLGLSPKVASYTSIAGPHRGSKLANLIMYNTPDWAQSALGGSLDFVYEFIFGDSNPNSIQNGYDLCTDYMTGVFNPNTPDVAGIYYQSWAAKAKISCPNLILEPTWLILLGMEGDNDGLVSVNSAKWGNFRGVESAAWYSPGCDHGNIIDQIFGITPGFDAPEFFVDIVSELKGKGY